MKKIYRFFKEKILEVLAFYKIKKYGKPQVKSSIETIDYILNSNLSVSRFGDGEFDIINGNSIKFQEYDKRLADKLKCILKNNREDLITCIPEIYSKKTLNRLKVLSKIFWLSYIKNHHYQLLTYINLNSTYYDSCVTRPYIRYKRKYIKISDELFKKIKLLWLDKNIIIVEGELSRLGVNNDLFQNAKSIERIICPSKNAFSRYDDILKSIELNSKDKIVIISLGPTATVLSADLAEKGIRAIDLGHIDLEYEWYIQKADKKVPIKNKFVNEINNNYKITNVEDENYNKSIIDKIL